MIQESATLTTAAVEVAELYRTGRLRQVEAESWRQTWRNLLAELRRRAPGFPLDDYESALNDGFFATR